MKDVIRVKDRYYILSTSSLTDDRTRVLKHNDSFAVYDRRGDIEPLGLGALGIYRHETRFLSQWVLRLGKHRPLLLSSAVKEDNASLTVDLTNADIHADGQLLVPRGTVHIERSKFIWNHTQYEQIRLLNYSVSAIHLSLSIQFAADFADIFEVRGMKRDRRGQQLKEHIDGDEVILDYCGLDNLLRRTRVRCSPRPTRVTASEILLDVSLPPKAQESHLFSVSCESGEQMAGPPPYEVASAEATQSLCDKEKREARISSANEQFNHWLDRSRADVRMMLTHTRYGPYPYAGVPWFSTPFGRDGIITALEMLWLDPSIARGVLAFLAATQAKDTIPEIDAEPGKIVHEIREGEMAALKEIPFGCYYGSVDSTPLFVILAGAYYRRTGDLDLIRHIWPNIDAALNWIDQFGDADGDGFVEYSRHSKTGLIQQGWKDSSDSVFHADGKLAEGPIALCEVQGYVYAAKCLAVELAEVVGEPQLCSELKHECQELRHRFEHAFWCEDICTYALALDGRKRPCRVRASNAGHCLFAGIAKLEHAKLISRTLFEEDFFSGWGVRTLSTREVRYNAMSYHNGSVWPHDNAIIAAGLARYGYKDAATCILNGMLDASSFLEVHRLPELFCGFPRRLGEGPTLYPVACAPQAWAAASVFFILQACLGLEVQSDPPTVFLRRACLPESIPQVEVKNLRVGDGSLDMVLDRAGQSVATTIVRKDPRIDIISIK